MNNESTNPPLQNRNLQSQDWTLNRHKFSPVYKAFFICLPFGCPQYQSRILSNSRFSFWKWARVVLISESLRRDTLSAPRSFASLANSNCIVRGKGRKKGTGPAVPSPPLITILATRNETDYLGVSTGYPHNFWSEQIRYFALPDPHAWSRLGKKKKYLAR